jgi:plasmid stabilization system protein ParE
MGVRLTWSSVAQRDLDEIEAYINAENPGAADSFCAQLVRQIDRLKEFPELGSVVPEFPDGDLRQLVHGNYRILYRVAHAQSAVKIVRVWHGARDFPRIR